MDHVTLKTLLSKVIIFHIVTVFNAFFYQINADLVSIRTLQISPIIIISHVFFI